MDTLLDEYDMELSKECTVVELKGKKWSGEQCPGYLSISTTFCQKLSNWFCSFVKSSQLQTKYMPLDTPFLKIDWNMTVLWPSEFEKNTFKFCQKESDTTHRVYETLVI